MLIFIAVLTIMYLLFPKQAGQSFGSNQYDGLVISEVMASNRSAVPDENGEFSDWLELYNGTGADLNMEGVMITNRTDSITFPFPAYNLRAGERIVIFASGSYQLDPTKPFHGKFKISSAGDHIYLYDPDMFLIDEIITPTLMSDSSYILKINNEDGSKSYETTTFYSPGFENTEEGFVAYRSTHATNVGDLIINEVSPDPKIGIPDEDGEIVDWVELRNTTNKPISLGGYYLSDNERKPLQWSFPEGAFIPANGYYLVYCSRKDKMQGNGIPHTNFGISAERETIVLSDGLGRMIDRISIENVPPDYSIGRTETGEWKYFTLSSPGHSNDEQGQARADFLFRAYNPTGVYITEVLASNDSYPVGASGSICDYVELYNSSGQNVDLAMYGLSDNIKRPRKWQFPQGTVIGPGQYLVVLLDGQSEISTISELHASFSIARLESDTITFCDPTGKLLDRIPLKSMPSDHSYGRNFEQDGFYFYNEPTPLAANGTGYIGYVNSPSFSLRGGEYKTKFELEITVPEGTEVYYTLDGATPTLENGLLYTSGQKLSFIKPTVVRARAFDPGARLQPSEIITQTYLPSLYHAFPIVSLSTDPDNLWHPETGMLTVGEDVVKEMGVLPFKNTVYREVKENLPPKEGFVEVYDKEGNQVISQGMEFSLQGQFSLDMPQKSFKIRAKAKFGSKYFEGALFEDRPYEHYKSFVLRMSGNDNAWTRLIDGFQGRLIDEFNLVTDKPSTVIHQAWKPVVVYLNGVYWGHYNMRERVDRYFVAQHEGLELEQADNMDILEANFAVNDGSNAEYKEMISRVKKSDPANNEEDLQYILDRVDVDNYFDYMAFQIFFGNSDPGNIRYYKLHEEGAKWKWIFYDSDYGLFNSQFNSPRSFMDPDGAGQQDINNTLIVKLLENDEMLDKFLTRLGEIFQVYTTEFMTSKLEIMVAQLEPEMPLHFARWAEETDKAITFDNPSTPEGAIRYWNDRLDRLRNTLKKRPTYFYEMVQEQFAISDEQMVNYFGEKPVMPEDAQL